VEVRVLSWALNTSKSLMAKIVTESSGDPDYYDIWESAGARGYFKSGGGGFLYEDYLYSKCKDLGLIPPGFAPAGSANDLPDLKLRVAGVGQKTYTKGIQPQVAKIEIKLNTEADFGQSGLKWAPGRNWYLDGQNSPEGLQMRTLLNRMGVPSKVNAAWGEYGPPKKFTAAKTGRDMNKKDYEYDIQSFKDVMLTGAEAPNVTTLFQYYGSKQTNYIQIGGGYGLYYMGSDPLNLKTVGVKAFDGTLKLRIRRKPGGSRTEPWNYRFSTALLIDKKPRQSSFDLEQSGEDLLYYLDKFGVFT
jgi:hypothetical protein